jgi:hypothetical protein
MNDGKILPLVLIALLQACATAPIKASDAATPISTTPGATATTLDQGRSNPSEGPEKGRSELTQRSDSRQPQADQPRSTTPPEYCAPDSYRQFFWHFVKGFDYSNNRIRLPYTSASVQVRDYQNPDKVLGIVDKQNYDGFKIDSLDYTLVYLDETITDPNAKARLKVDFTRQTDTTFRVDYVKAEFEINPEEEDNNGQLIRTYGAPGAYIFEHRDGCWNLTQEFRSATVTGTDRAFITEPQELAGLLTKGMAYADLRKAALQNGWLPLPSPNCKSNVGGTAAVCDEIPEVNACSGDGHCLMFFEHRLEKTKLSVSTYGPYSDWRTPGAASKLRVKTWGMGEAAAPFD